jgi:hypothetical protein
MAESSSKLINMLILKSKETTYNCECTFSKNSIVIGRSTALEGISPDFCLDFDEDVDIEHAKLWQSQNKWFIKDSESSAGTCVDNYYLRNDESLLVCPGQIIKTGNTLWTFFTNEWIYCIHGGLLLYCKFSEIFSYLMHHCKMKVIDKVYATNVHSCTSESVDLIFEIQGYSDPFQVRIPPIKANTAQVVDVDRLLLRYENKEYLRMQLRPDTGVLTLKVKGSSNVTINKSITILGYRDWPHLPVFRKTIAAFVSCWNPLIVYATVRCQTIGKAANDFSSLIKSREPGLEIKIMNVLYDFFCMHRDIYYERPTVTNIGGNGTAFQLIKTPDRIFFPDAFGKTGRGTCLDLTLMMAGCLENIGLSPLVIFTGLHEDKPNHALLGCFVGVAGHEQVISDISSLKAKSGAGIIVLLECTGFAKGGLLLDNKVSFLESTAYAKKNLEAAKWACAVNIKALRNSIPVMENQMEPEASRIVYEAIKLSTDKNRDQVQTDNLFYGVLKTGGMVAKWLFEHAELDLNEKLLEFENCFSNWNSASPLMFTESYNSCMNDAKKLSDKSGFTCIREQDIIWAILKNKKDIINNMSGYQENTSNDTFINKCFKAGIDLKKLSDIFQAAFPYKNDRIASKMTGTKI